MTAFTNIVFAAISQGMLWAILGLGVYLTYRILDYADLSVEGSYPMGMAIVAIFISKGTNPYLATFFALLGGMIAGFLTGMLHTKFKVPSLLSGILTMTALYSVNLRIMGTSNLTLDKEETIFADFVNLGLSRLGAEFALGAVFLIIVISILWYFFNTELGFAIRATGDNQNMVKAQGINANNFIVLGLVLSNALVALAGALIAQSDAFADVSSGTGTIVIGLASVIIGEVLFSSKTIFLSLVSVVGGSVIYRIIIASILYIGIKPQDLKFIYALILALALYLPSLKQKKKMSGGSKNA